MSRADTSDPALKKAIENLRTNGGDNHWVMFGYEKGGSKIKVVSTGEDGLDELKDELNEGKILYALLRYDIIKMAKYVFITWCGSGVQGTVKGHFGNHCKDMEQFMKGYFHVQINARDEDDLVEKQLKEKLTKAVGANYDSGQKIQGNKQGGVSSVSEGRQAVTRALPTVSRPDRSVDSDSSKKFWEDHRRKEEEERNQRQQELLRQQMARAQINPEQREKFWQQQKQEQTQAPGQKQVEIEQQKSQEYWKAQREAEAAEKAEKERAAAAVQVKADASGLKNKFETLAKPQETPQVQKTGAKWSKPTAEPTYAAPEPAAKPKPKPKPAAATPVASAAPSTPAPSFKPPPPSTPPPSVKPPEPAAPPPVAAKPPPPEPAAPAVPAKPAAPPPVVNLPPKPAAPPPSVPPKPAAPPPKPQPVPEPEPEPEPEPQPQASGYAQAGYEQAGYAQAGYAQAGYAQAGYAQAGYAQAGYAQAGYAQAGYAQGGYAQAGYAQGGYTGKLVCRALYDFNGEQEGDLSFAEGDVITVLDQSDPGGWWQGELNGVVGVFPMNFVELSPN